MFHPTCLRSPAHKVLTNCKQQYCSRRHSDSVCKFCLQAKQLSQSSNWLLFFINPILTHISGVIQPRTAISLTAKGNFSKSTTRQHRTPLYLHQSLVQLSFSVQSILKRGSMCDCIKPVNTAKELWPMLLDLECFIIIGTQSNCSFVVANKMYKRS